MKNDNRYTITREYRGNNMPQYVVRFRGVLLGSCSNVTGAKELAKLHKDAREAAWIK